MGPANSHLTQVQETEPFFFAFLASAIATAEILRATYGWEFPTTAIKKNLDVEGRTWFAKLNDRYYPGDIGFDPLGLKPEDPQNSQRCKQKNYNMVAWQCLQLWE